MKAKKTLLAMSALSVIGVAGLAGSGLASAEADTDSTSLITKVAQKFNLNEEEVKSIFEEDQAARKSEKQARQTERLQEAVDDGDITAEQKTKIETKLKELQTELQSERDELKKWATDNNVDAKYLTGSRGGNNDRLQKAVDDGEITAEQKELVEKKQQEIKDKQAASDAELDQWAEDNDIDKKYLKVLGKGSYGGHGSRGGFGRY